MEWSHPLYIIIHRTGERKRIGDSGELSDENKIIINARNKRIDAETAAETAKELEEFKQTRRVDIAATKTQAEIAAAAIRAKELGNPITITMPDGSSRIIQVDKSGKLVDLKGAEGGSTLRPNAPLSPSGQATDLINRARQYAIENPWARQFINTDDPDNLISAPGGYGNPDEATYKQIREAIYGPAMKRSTSITEKAAETKAPNASKGWKYVPKAGGGWTAVKSDGK